MNNIEILEEYLDKQDGKFVSEHRLMILEAIENLIQENKELKEKNKKIVEKTAQLININRNVIKENFIPKSKVKEKIEEIKSKMNNDCIALHGFQREAQIDILQEILEGE